jgi:hypothetical protein
VQPAILAFFEAEMFGYARTEAAIGRAEYRPLLTRLAAFALLNVQNHARGVHVGDLPLTAVPRIWD